jgi:hypothetical protein
MRFHLEKLLLVAASLLVMPMLGCVKIPDQIKLDTTVDVKTPDVAKAASELREGAARAGGALDPLDIRGARLAIEARESRIRQLDQDIRDRDLISQGKTPPKRTRLGDLMPLLPDTLYTADTDGFVIVVTTPGASGFNIRTESDQGPVLSSFSTSPASGMAPIRRNQKWKVTTVPVNGAGVFVSFMPLSTP